MSQQLSDTQFPSWWDIHTHRANPLCRMAVLRSAYGNGRSMVADWGRTGSCQIINEKENLEVYEQISANLAGGLHFTGCPRPLLQAHYHLSEWSQARLDEWLLSSSAAHATARDFGIAQLLDDAVFGRQACAAFLAAKFFGTVRKNIPALLPPQRAGRRVEPTFLGRGCVRISESGHCGSSPVVFWAPPLPLRCEKPTAPHIYSALLDDLCPLSPGSPAAFQLPENFCNSSVCELETFQLENSKYYILVRTTSGQVFTCTTSYESGPSLDDGERDEGDSRWKLLSANCLQPPELAYRATSVAVCPWRPRTTSSLRNLDWAVAGRRCGPPSGAFSLCHLGVVELFDSKTNSLSWHGQIPLDCPGENITSEMVGVMSASSITVSDGGSIDEQEILWYPNHAVYDDLLGYCSEVIRTRQQRRITPEQVLRRAELDFQLSHASTWLRVGFGGWPGQLALTTPKRLLTLDTRLPLYTTVA
ncbi:unnamed protein product, partial [Dibothriocephalus latus]